MAKKAGGLFVLGLTEGDSIVVVKVTFGNIMNSSGQTPPLQQGDDGRVRLSTKAMKVLDDEFGNNPSQPNANDQRRKIKIAENLVPTGRIYSTIAL